MPPRVPVGAYTPPLSWRAISQAQIAEEAEATGELRTGATLVLTLKQPSASTKTAAADTGEVEGALAAGGFRDLRTAWLWANGRKERTLAATYT